MFLLTTAINNVLFSILMLLFRTGAMATTHYLLCGSFTNAVWSLGPDTGGPPFETAAFNSLKVVVSKTDSNAKIYLNDGLSLTCPLTKPFKASGAIALLNGNGNTANFTSNFAFSGRIE